MTTITITPLANLCPAPSASLSRAEVGIARLVSQGLSNKQIASHLCLSVRTVESHISHILTKIGGRSRTQIAIAAMTGAL